MSLNRQIRKTAKAVVDTRIRYAIDHPIRAYYIAMWKEAREAFTEDNDATLRAYLREMFEEAMPRIEQLQEGE
jgi:hypothetical protein